MKIPYPVVSSQKPFYRVVVSGLDLSTIATTGDTKVVVYRVWNNTSGTDVPADVTASYSGEGSGGIPINPVTYVPLEEKKNRFTFVLDDNLFLLDGGRYRADFYYKGTYVSHSYLVYCKPKVSIVGSANV